MEIPEDRFVPLAALQTAFRFWWFVFVLAAAGGIAGWLVSRAMPPVYEAVGHFSTSIDYVSTGPLTQFEEDTAINLVSDVVFSNKVIKAVVNRAAKEGIHTTAAAISKSTVLERRVNVWDLRVRNADPQAARRLANLLVEEGQAALLDAYQHALKAEQWNRYLLSLETCLAKTADSEQAGGQCSPARLSEIQNDMQTAGKMYADERLASQGLFSGLTIGPAEPADAASGPVLFNRNLMVLGGCFIGLVLAIALVEMGIPGRIGKKSGRS